MKPRSETPKDEGPWAWQAREAAAQAGQLGINAYAIYCALTHFQSAAATNHKRRFAASYEQIAEHVGCSQRTVCRCLLELEKAGLVHVFSGANGAHRATRNAFFLTSISHAPQAHGNAPQARLVNASQACDVNAPQARLNKNKEQLLRAASSGSGSSREQESSEPACPPLTGGSGSKNDQAEITKPEDLARLARMKSALGFL
jgi:DNA-binding IscR family transcriptional regulator